MTVTEIEITIAVGLIMMLLGAVATRHYSSRRRINFIMPSLIDVVNISHLVKDNIKIYYRDVPIQSLWVLRLIVKNNGNFDINKDMIRNLPKLTFKDSVKIIDIEPVIYDDNALISGLRSSETSIDFDIEFLKRGKQTAFQILFHTVDDSRVRMDDIKLSEGVIENTTVKLIKLGTTVIPYPFSRLVGSGHKRILIFVLMLIIGSLFFAIMGILALFGHQQYLVPPPTKDLSTKDNIFMGLFFIVYSFMFAVPAILLLRRYRYIKIFRWHEEGLRK
jgi:hypothetical protein